METILTKDLDFGVEKQTDHKLFINCDLTLVSSKLKDKVSLDIETDEKDNYVCISLFSGEDVFYFDRPIGEIYTLFQRKEIVGQNLKGDFKWLRQWNCPMPKEAIYYDTMIASYVQDNNRETHGLKSLSKSLLGITYPHYNDLVGKGKNRVTMDKQPLDIRANYNGLDALVTYKLYKYFEKNMIPSQKRIFNTIEMPLNRILYEMETKGIKIDLVLLEELDKDIAERLRVLLDFIHSLTNNHIRDLLIKYENEKLDSWKKTAVDKLKEIPHLNPNSWQQKRFVLETLGYTIRSTDKGELQNYKDKDLINALLQYSEFAKLYNGFIKSFESLPTLPRVHTTFNQLYQHKKQREEWVDIETSRLSSSDPVNLQQVPNRTETGKKLRKLFIPEPGNIFISADYSQIELRIAAHYSGDPILLNAYHNNLDVHEQTAKALGVDRFWGKTANFILAFGGGWKKLMISLNKSLDNKVTEQQAKDFVYKYWNTFKVLKSWKDGEIGFARKYGGVNTIIYQWNKVVGLNDIDNSKRWFAERQAISKKIQGSAAGILKLSMIKCYEDGYLPSLTVHDELLFEIEDDKTLVEAAKKKIKEIMESVITLEVPLVVNVGSGYNWGDAKNV